MKELLQNQIILYLEIWFILLILLHLILIIGLQFDDGIKLDTENYETPTLFFGIEGMIFIFSFGFVSLLILLSILFRAIATLFIVLLSSLMGVILHITAYREPQLIELIIQDLRDYTIKERIKDAIELRTIRYAIKMPHLMQEIRR